MDRAPQWLSSRTAVPFFFLALLLAGVFLVDDYGMSWDEAIQRKHGFVALDYATEFLGIKWEKAHPDDKMAEYQGRHYQLIYSMFCAGWERALGIEQDFRARYLLRHFVVFLLFWSSLIVLYRLARLRFGNWRWALLAVLMVVLSPRIFANAFYNPKDMVVFPFYLVAMYSCILFLRKPEFRTALLHGVVTGFALNTRLTALYIPIFTLLLIVLDLIQKQFRRNILGKYAALAGIYLLVSFLVMVLLFPYAWENTFARLAESYRVMANFPWGGHNLYFGEYIPGDETPWHYIPVWIGITTPIAYLLLFGVGMMHISWQTLKNLRLFRFWQSDQELLDLAFAGFCVGPVVTVIFLDSTLYNGWRHLYFTYPAMILLALAGLQAVSKASAGGWPGKIAYLLLAASLIRTGLFFLRHHPHEPVYFNGVVHQELTTRFDMDYWGLGYKQAFEEIARRSDSNQKIKVRCANYPCEDNFRFLPEPVREKLELVWITEDADYFLSNFRRPEEHKKYMTQTYPYAREYFSIRVQGYPIIGVYDLGR